MAANSSSSVSNIVTRARRSITVQPCTGCTQAGICRRGNFLCDQYLRAALDIVAVEVGTEKNLDQQSIGTVEIMAVAGAIIVSLLRCMNLV